MVFQVNGLDHGPLLRTVPREVGEVLERVAALLLYLERFLALLAELLHRPLEVEDDVVLGRVQHLAHGAGYAVGVVVRVLYCLQLRRDLGGKAVGQGMGDLAEDVGAGGDSCEVY